MTAVFREEPKETKSKRFNVWIKKQGLCLSFLKSRTKERNNLLKIIFK